MGPERCERSEASAVLHPRPGRSSARRRGLPPVLPVVPRRWRARRHPRGFDRHRLVSRTGDRSKPSHHDYRGSSRPRPPGLARGGTWHADVLGRYLQRGGLAGFAPSTRRSVFPSSCAEVMTMPEPHGLSRRDLFMRLATLFSGAAGVILALPMARYLLSPIVRGRHGRDESWVTLGSLDRFPVGQTRLTAFRNPTVNASDGATAEIPCWVRRVDQQTVQVFAINCAHLGCP